MRMACCLQPLPRYGCFEDGRAGGLSLRYAQGHTRLHPDPVHYRSDNPLPKRAPRPPSRPACFREPIFVFTPWRPGRFAGGKPGRPEPGIRGRSPCGSSCPAMQVSCGQAKWELDEDEHDYVTMSRIFGKNASMGEGKKRDHGPGGSFESRPSNVSVAGSRSYWPFCRSPGGSAMIQYIVYVQKTITPAKRASLTVLRCGGSPIFWVSCRGGLQVHYTLGSLLLVFFLPYWAIHEQPGQL